MVSHRIPPRLSAYLYYKHHDLGESIRKLQRRFSQYSVATIWRHATKAPNQNRSLPRSSPGRKSLITVRDERGVLRALLHLRETEGTFSARRVQVVAGVEHVHVRTIRRVLNNNGYALRQARRKGLLSVIDTKNRLKFAKRVLKDSDENLWKHEICFYLDGKSFVHKLNPKDQARAPGAKVWRKKNEGLKRNCTAKGNKAGHGGRTAHFMVAITYGKGVILCQHYEKLSGKYFASLIEESFQGVFARSCNPEGNMFLQDGDPSQNSKVAMTELDKIGAVKFGIPARSPDCNPIENLFHTIERKLKTDAINRNITYEPYQQYVDRVRETLLNFPAAQIDKIIDSMHGRMHQIVAAGGERLRY